MRGGVALIGLVLALLAAPASAGTVAYWPSEKVLRKLDGVLMHVGPRTVRIRGDTTLCSGEGRSVRRRGVRMWRDFACTHTTFTKGGVDRDIDFRLHVRSASRFSLSDAHWVGGR